MERVKGIEPEFFPDPLRAVSLKALTRPRISFQRGFDAGGIKWSG